MKKNIVLFSLISFSAVLIDPFVNVKPAYSHSFGSRFECKAKTDAAKNELCFTRSSKVKHSHCVYKQMFKDGHRHDPDTRKGEKRKCKRK